MYDDLIIKVGDFLKLTIPTDKADVLRSEVALNNLKMDLIQAKVNAFHALVNKRWQYRLPKDKELTDFDRKILLDQATSDAQRAYDHLSDLNALLDARMALLRLSMTI